MASQQPRVSFVSDTSESDLTPSEILDIHKSLILSILPAEMRNMIYEYVFSASFTVQAVEGQSSPGKQSFPRAEIVDPPGLLLANHQINAEACRFFYTTATFQFPAEHGSVKLFKSFLRHLPDDHAALISKIRLYLPRDQWRSEWSQDLARSKGIKANMLLEEVRDALNRPNLEIQINVWRDGGLEKRIFEQGMRDMRCYKQRCQRRELVCAWTRDPEGEMEKENSRIKDLLQERVQRNAAEGRERMRILNEVNSQAALGGLQALQLGSGEVES